MVADRETHRERRYKQNDGKRQTETERHRDGGRQRDTERKAVQNLFLKRRRRQRQKDTEMEADRETRRERRYRKSDGETEVETERHRDGGRQRDTERKAVQKKTMGRRR